MSSVPMTLDGSGQNVSVRARLTNLSTQQNAVLGTYTFNFATGKYTTNSEDIYGAFQAVNGFPQPETDPPTEAPQPQTEQPHNTDPPQNDHQEGVNGFTRDGIWYYYTDADGILGTWVNGGWVFYEPGVNGYWDENNNWIWN